MSTKKNLTQDEQALDQHLDKYAVQPANAELHMRILANAKTQTALEPSPKLSPEPSSLIQLLITAMGGWRIAGPALAFSLALGMGLNLINESLTQTDTSITVWELAMLSTESEPTK